MRLERYLEVLIYAKLLSILCREITSVDGYKRVTQPFMMLNKKKLSKKYKTMSACISLQPYSFYTIRKACRKFNIHVMENEISCFFFRGAMKSLCNDIQLKVKDNSFLSMVRHENCDFPS
jgi:hypothetical protein